LWQRVARAGYVNSVDGYVQSALVLHIGQRTGGGSIATP